MLEWGLSASVHGHDPHALARNETARANEAVRPLANAAVGHEKFVGPAGGSPWRWPADRLAHGLCTAPYGQT